MSRAGRVVELVDGAIASIAHFGVDAGVVVPDVAVTPSALV
jgi:hypothetical protein